MSAHVIMIVVNDPLILHNVESAFKDQGYRIGRASGLSAPIQGIVEKQLDLPLDALADAEGNGAIDAATRSKADMVSIILTDIGDIDDAVRVLKRGLTEHLQPPGETATTPGRVAIPLERNQPKREMVPGNPILPVCCVCKDIRDDAGRKPGAGEWMTIEKFLLARAGVTSTSTYCPKCHKNALAAIEIAACQLTG